MQHLFNKRFNSLKCSKYSAKFCVIAFLSVIINQAAFAQTNNRVDTSGHLFGKSAKGKWLVGAKIGKIDNNAEDISDSDALGVVLGYEFDRPVGIGGSATVELEYITGDKTYAAGERASYEAEALNLFFAYRSPGTLYYKFKLGLSYSNVEASGLFVGGNIPLGNVSAANDLGDFNDVPFTDTVSEEDVSLAAGIGLGVRIKDFAVIELEHVGDAGKNDLSLTTLSAIGSF